MNLASAYFSPEASTFAEGTDSVFMFITWVSIFFFVAIVGLMTLFVIKYRRKSEDEVTPNISHNLLLEIVWSIVPIILVMFMFYWGYKAFDRMNDPKAAIAEADGKEVIDLYVKGYQWYWEIAYPHGLKINSNSSKVEGNLNFKKFSDDEKENDRNYMVVPVNRVVRLNMTSNDVIHSFAVPAFRVKKDVIKKRNSMIWFKATEKGTYIYTCNEMCGKDHSKMIGYIRVVSEDKYKEWVKRTAVDTRSTWEKGRDRYNSVCKACHTLDGTVKPGQGPSWKGLFTYENGLPVGKVDHAIEGEVIKQVGFDYIEESVNRPMKKLAKGFQGGMGPQTMTDAQVREIILFMSSPDKDPNPKTTEEK